MNPMRLLSTSLLLLQLAGTPAPAQKPREDASIEGVVVRFENGEPLRRAQLRLYQVRPPSELAATPPADSDSGYPRFPQIAPVTTEADGIFRFTKLKAGSYRLSVACNGYVSTVYGSESGQGEGTIITIVDGQAIKGISFGLRRAATISGHLRDSDGSPITGLTVSLLKVGFYPDGLRTMENIATSITDDRGEYRLIWVSPGRYYLNASSNDRYSLTDNMVREKPYPPFYFPGTFDLSRAAIIEVLPGAEMGSMDIVMTRPVTYRIQGNIVDAGGGPSPKSVHIELMQRSEGNIALEYVNTGNGIGNAVYTNGTFEITDVLPGSYMLHASTSRDFNASLPADAIASVRSPTDLFRVAFGNLATALLPLEVSGSDISGIKMTLTAGVRVPLRTSVEGREFSTLPDFEKIRIGLEPRRNQVEGSSKQSASLNSNGTGVVENVETGEYRVAVVQLPPDFYLKEARMDNSDVLNGFWKLNGTPTGVLDVVIGDKPGRVDGTLTDALSKSVPGVQVALIPENHRHRYELYKTADTDEKGQFAFRGVAPGDYRVFSWEALEPNSWFDREVLAKFEQQGKLVHVTEASQQTVDIKLIPAPKD